jgi:outer membrane protein assembly factor BamB
VARVVRTYALLLFLALGFCPQDALGGQRTKKVEPAVTAVLPAELAWQVVLPLPPSAGAAMDDVRAYIPLEGERFIAIERETGMTVWTVDIESAWPPLVHEGTVFLAASDELHALDAATGTHKWRVPIGRDAPGRGAMAPMALVEDLLIALVAPDEVWAFRVSDGQRLWVRALGGRTGRVSMAVNATGIYVSVVDRLVRVMPADGTVQWERTLPGQVATTFVAHDLVFVGSTSNEIFAFDADDGSLAWKFRFGGDVIGIAARGDLVFVASLDNLLRALKHSSGNQVWKRALATRPVAPVLTFDGVVAVAGVESIATFDSRTGTPIAKFDAPNMTRGLPMVDPTPEPFAVSITVVTGDGRAMGLRPEGMMFREKPVTPLMALPGRPLQKEAAPLPVRTEATPLP